MPNVTLSIPEDLLKEGRKYAQKNNTSLNALIRMVLSKIIQKRKSSGNEGFIKLSNKLNLKSNGSKFNRAAIYEDLLK